MTFKIIKRTFLNIKFLLRIENHWNDKEMSQKNLLRKKMCKILFEFR